MTGWNIHISGWDVAQQCALDDHLLASILSNLGLELSDEEDRNEYADGVAAGLGERGKGLVKALAAAVDALPGEGS